LLAKSEAEEENIPEALAHLAEAIQVAIYWDQMLKNNVNIRPEDLPPGTWAILQALWSGRSKAEREQIKGVGNKPNNNPPKRDYEGDKNRQAKMKQMYAGKDD
jgi:hypothetical protein